MPAEVPRSSYGLVIGIEADPDRPDWHDWYSRRIQFCQWTIQSKPGHPVLIDVVASITEETLRRKAIGELDKKHMKSVVEFTGPALWTDAVFKFFNNPEYFDMSTSKGNITWKQFTGITQAKKVGDVVVLPITSFSPGVGQMGAGEEDDPMAFVKHAFEGKNTAVRACWLSAFLLTTSQAPGSPRTSAISGAEHHHHQTDIIVGTGHTLQKLPTQWHALQHRRYRSPCRWNIRFVRQRTSSTTRLTPVTGAYRYSSAD